MTSLRAMVKANLKMSLRNRQALFWNLAFPALFILLFGAIFSGSDTLTFNVGITGESSTFKTTAQTVMEQDDSFKIHTGTSSEELKALNDGDRDLVVDFGAVPASGGVPPVQIYYDETEGPNASVAINVVRQILLGVAQGENPVPITQTPVSSTDISYIDFLVPGILAMAIMNSGVIGLSTAFVTYRERGILRRIKVTPFPLTSFVFARVVSQLLIAVLQAVILVGMGALIFGVAIHGSILLLLVSIVIGSLAFLAIGFALAGVAKNTETAASYANLVTFPMLFLSGVFFDVNAGPAWLRPITRVLPLRYLVDALRDTMTRGKGLDHIWIDLAVLLFTFVAAMAVAIRFFRWESRAA